MDGKVALVTGGGSGPGKACVHALVARGATVVIADISKEAAERVLADHGRLDVAVNNAGIGGDQVPTGEYPIESWRQVLSVAALVAFLASGEASFVTGSYYTVDGGYTAQ